MPKADYPQGSDLTAFLTGAGFTLNGLDLEAAAAAGVADFERAIGYYILAVDGTRKFDPPGVGRASNTVDLREPLVAATKVTLAGRELTFEQDYDLLPQGSADRAKPYRLLQIWHYNYPDWLPGWRRSLVVEGRWGYGDTIPDDAWYAMLVRGGYLILPTLSAAISHGLVSWAEAGVQENYGAQPLIYLGEGWTKTYEDTVNRYREVRAGL